MQLPGLRPLLPKRSIMHLSLGQCVLLPIRRDLRRGFLRYLRYESRLYILRQRCERRVLRTGSCLRRDGMCVLRNGNDGCDVADEHYHVWSELHYGE